MGVSIRSPPTSGRPLDKNEGGNFKSSWSSNLKYSITGREGRYKYKSVRRKNKDVHYNVCDYD